MARDIRDQPIEPVRDDSEAGPVAFRAAGEILRLMRVGGDGDPETAERIIRILGGLRDDDLEGVQLLGMTLQAVASSVREARRIRRA